MSTEPPHQISAIVAMAENRVIGRDNQLPWRLPADLKHFKSITTGHAILMGRKTYESIRRPLPNRTNIILTRDPIFVADGCIVVHSFEEALRHTPPNQTLFIIGGAEIYRMLLPNAQRLYLTLIHHPFEGDTYFQALEERDWKEVSRKDYPADAENSYAYSFLTFERLRQS